MSLRFLHLSDIHFSTKPGDEQIVHTDVRDQLLHDLRNEIVPRLEKIDTVLIAGDIAFSGKREEYQKAAEWLEEVTSICKCERTAVLTVPGNHDVDCGRILPTTKMIHKRLRTCSLPEAMHELVELAASNDGTLTDKLAEYQAFASSYGCHFKSPSRPHWDRLYTLDGNRNLNILGLTTVQVCDLQDQKGALLLGRHQYIFDRAPCVEQIVVMHHPLEWLKDRPEATQYLSTRARVLLFGHEHMQDISKIVDANHEERLVISSGAVTPDHATEPYIYRYNILDFSLADVQGDPCLAVTVFPRVWIPERTRFDADSARLGGRDSTTFSLRCPQFTLPPIPTGNVLPVVPDPTNAHSNMQTDNIEAFSLLSYFFWRYLGWQDRLKVLVKSDVLPNVSQVPLPQAVEHMALERARKEGKLGQIWDLTMHFVPNAKREANPFVH